MFVLELNDYPGYYAHKNSGTTTKDQYENICGKLKFVNCSARDFTNLIANAKIFNTREKAETARNKLQGMKMVNPSPKPPIGINVVEVFIISERELDENPILKKPFDVFRLARKLSTR